MTIQLHRFNPLSEPDITLLRRWWEIGNAVDAERAHQTWPAWESTQVAMTTPHPERGLVHLMAEVDGHLVGAGLLILFAKDNPHLAALDLYVLPSARRQGVGGTLLAELERIASTEHGRSTLLAEVYRRPEAVVPGESFALGRGYSLANLEAEKSLSVEEFRARREALEEIAEAKRGSYRVVTYGNRIPEEYLPSYCSLIGEFMSQIPLGELELEDSEYTPERIREAEDRAIAVGQEWVHAVALNPAGEVVGVSDLRYLSHRPEQAAIGITQVHQDHRGHALGLALKLATHNALLEQNPAVEWIFTSNADANQHMNAVNERLGYAVHEELLEMQKKLDA